MSYTKAFLFKYLFGVYIKDDAFLGDIYIEIRKTPANIKSDPEIC